MGRLSFKGARPVVTRNTCMDLWERDMEQEGEWQHR